MADQVFGLSSEGVRRTAETNRRVLGTLPDVGRRTRRVYPPGAGSRNESIDYEVIEAGCPFFAAGQSQWVYAVVLRRDCESTVNVGDVVQIFDPDEDLFNLPVDLLVGARGTAHLRRNDGFTNIVCAVVPEPYEDCVWIGTNIKCREEIYGE